MNAEEPVPAPPPPPPAAPPVFPPAFPREPPREVPIAPRDPRDAARREWEQERDYYDYYSRWWAATASRGSPPCDQWAGPAPEFGRKRGREPWRTSDRREDDPPPGERLPPPPRPGDYSDDPEAESRSRELAEVRARATRDAREARAREIYHQEYYREYYARAAAYGGYDDDDAAAEKRRRRDRDRLEDAPWVGWTPPPAAPAPAPAPCFEPVPVLFVGVYGPEERRRRIARFHEKRKKRVWGREGKVYNCRKAFATERKRVQGRFVPRAQAQAMEDAQKAADAAAKALAGGGEGAAAPAEGQEGAAPAPAPA